MIAIGINNYGAEKYWRHVYNELDISMAPETVSFLQSQDKSRLEAGLLLTLTLSPSSSKKLKKGKKNCWVFNARSMVADKHLSSTIR